MTIIQFCIRFIKNNSAKNAVTIFRQNFNRLFVNLLLIFRGIMWSKSNLISSHFGSLLSPFYQKQAKAVFLMFAL